MAESLYRVAWQVKATGLRGGGTKYFPKTTVDGWVEQLNRETPALHHWTEKQPDPDWVSDDAERKLKELF